MTARLTSAAALAAAVLAAASGAVAATQAAVSPDGRWRAVVENAATDADPDSGPASLLRLEPVAGGPGRVLITGRGPEQDPKRSFHSFERPTWSLDGGFVYVQASAYATSPAVHQVDVRTGAERYVVDGVISGLIRTGPYRGMLLVSRHKYRANGEGSYDPVDVVRPDGKALLTVPGSETDEGAKSVRRWLKARGWKAS